MDESFHESEFLFKRDRQIEKYNEDAFKLPTNFQHRSTSPIKNFQKASKSEGTVIRKSLKSVREHKNWLKGRRSRFVSEENSPNENSTQIRMGSFENNNAPNAEEIFKKLEDEKKLKEFRQLFGEYKVFPAVENSAAPSKVSGKSSKKKIPSLYEDSQTERVFNASRSSYEGSEDCNKSFWGKIKRFFGCSKNKNKEPPQLEEEEQEEVDEDKEWKEYQEKITGQKKAKIEKREEYKEEQKRNSLEQEIVKPQTAPTPKRMGPKPIVVIPVQETLSPQPAEEDPNQGEAPRQSFAEINLTNEDAVSEDWDGTLPNDDDKDEEDDVPEFIQGVNSFDSDTPANPPPDIVGVGGNPSGKTQSADNVNKNKNNKKASTTSKNSKKKKLSNKSNGSQNTNSRDGSESASLSYSSSYSSKSSSNVKSSTTSKDKVDKDECTFGGRSTIDLNDPKISAKIYMENTHIRTCKWGVNGECTKAKNDCGNFACQEPCQMPDCFYL